MNSKLIVAGAVGGVVLAGNVIAQNVPMPHVIVESHRAVSTRIGSTSGGIPIQDASMGYTVTAEGLDISTPIGRQAQDRPNACQRVIHRHNCAELIE